MHTILRKKLQRKRACLQSRRLDALLRWVGLWFMHHVFKLTKLICVNVGRGSSVSIATRSGLGALGIESRWGEGGGARFSASVQTGPGAHPASSTMVTGFFPGGKAAGAWR